MKSKVHLTIILMAMLSFAYCIETDLITTIHRNGSITRQLIIKNDENDFAPGNVPIPFDLTWETDTTWEFTETNGERDTSNWILTATKLFPDVEGINKEYMNDRVSSNQELQRNAALSRKFMWFITVFRYSERIEKIVDFGCPIADFLDEEELSFLYLPKEAQTRLIYGSDSLHYKQLSEDMEENSEKWLWAVFFREWTNIFYDHFGGHPDLSITKGEMLSKENLVINHWMNGSGENEDEMDDMKWIFGEEQYGLLETEIDSAMDLLEEKTGDFWSFSDYGLEIRMPGRIIATNGYADNRSDSLNRGGILWTVQWGYYFNESFEMWVESRVNNYWAWLVTFFFLIFVITGFVTRYRNERS